MESLQSWPHERDAATPALVGLGLHLGLRSREIAELPLDHVDLTKRRIVVAHGGKSHRPFRTLPIPDVVLGPLRRALDERPHLFCRTRHQPTASIPWSSPMHGPLTHSLLKVGRSVGRNLAWHGLRLAAARTMSDVGIPDAIVDHLLRGAGPDRLEPGDLALEVYSTLIDDHWS